MALGQEPSGATGVVVGRVVNGVTGEGFAQVTVLTSVADRLTENESFPHAPTASDGTFRLPDVRPGGYRMIVQKRGFSIQNSAASLLVNVGPGEQVGPLQITLTPNGSVEGKVVDEDLAPQAGITVYALVRSGNWRVASDGATGQVITDRNGRYSLKALPDGNYFLLAVPEGTAAQAKNKLPLVPGFFPEAREVMQAVPITVAAGQVVSADIRLHRSSRHSVQGSVSDFPMGVAYKDLSLQLTPLDCELRELRKEAKVDARGRFLISDLPSGRYGLRLARAIEHNSYATAEYQEIEVGTEDIRDLSLHYAGPVLVRAHAAVENGASVPMTSMYVVLHAKWLVEFEHFGPEGTLQLPDVPPGQYSVTVANSPHGYYASSILANKQEAKDAPIELGSGETVDMEVKLRTGTGSITVTTGGFPFAAILVPKLIIPDHSNVQVRPSSQGRPVVFDNLAPGEYTLYSAINVSTDLWQLPEFPSALKEWGSVVELEENGNVQVAPSPLGEDVLKGTAQRLGLQFGTR